MGKITIKDLASLTGLSQATISLSLRDHPRIPSITKDRVLRKAQEVGYIYNRQAANLRMNRTRTLAVCLNTIENPVISRISTGLLHFLQSRDWMVMFGDTEDSAEKQSAFLNAAVEHNVGGVIVVPAVGSDISDLVHRSRIAPMVLAIREMDDSPIDQARIDYAGGVRAGVDHLVSLGHTRIGWLGGGLRTYTSRVGLSTFRSQLNRHNIHPESDWIRPCLTSRQQGFENMTALLRNGSNLTAVFCFSDLLANGALHALREAGKEPVRDVSIIGFDDLDEARFTAPPLTTLRIDQPRLGTEAARLLIERIAYPDRPKQVATVPAELVIRQSTGPAPGR